MKSILVYIICGILNLTKISAGQHFCESDTAGLNKCHDGGCNNPEPGSGEPCVCTFSKYIMEGKYCGVYQDQCLSNPCKNDAKCISGIGHPICECSEKFHGIYCQIPIAKSKINKKVNRCYKNWSVLDHTC